MPLGPNAAHRARPGASLHDPSWQLRVEGGWTNDNFIPLTNQDDDGFTNDVFAKVSARRNDERVELSAANRMLTERKGMRRTDVIDVAASYGQTARVGDLRFSLSGCAGVTSTGNYAGAPVQDWFHGTVGMGRRLGRTDGNTYHRTPLQDQYDGQRRFGLTLSGDSSASLALLEDHVSVEAGLEAQVAIGRTGVAYVRPHAGVEVRAGVSELDLYAAARAELTKAATVDPSLRINGGYNTSRPYVTLETQAGVRVWLLSAGVRGRFNDHGTGHHTGGVFTAIGLP